MSVVIHWLSQMSIERLIDQELPAPHGNRQGLSYGKLAILLLSYIITQADHRLCAVESWVNQLCLLTYFTSIFLHALVSIPSCRSQAKGTSALGF